MQKAKFLLFLLISLLASSSFLFAEETLTITTYYPSPYGSYKQLSVEDSTNDNLPTEALILRRYRADTTAPGAANFGRDLTFRLEGSTNNTDVLACRIRGAWEAGQTNDTTARDSYISLATMMDDTLDERMRITSAGNVGIGTTSPDYSLELYDATNTPAFGLSDDDVAHGVTTLAQTDTFFHVSSIFTTVGGAQITGLADATGIALGLMGVQSSNPTDTTPAISLIGTKASGTGVQDLAAAETVLQIANNDNAAAVTVLGNGDVGIGTTSPTSGPLEMGSGAYVTSGGVWTDASSRAYKQDIASLGLAEAIKTLAGLQPVTFRYKRAPDEQHVGFISEDVPELVVTKDRTGLSAMDIVAVLTKVVQQQQKEIETLKQEVSGLKRAL